MKRHATKPIGSWQLGPPPCFVGTGTETQTPLAVADLGLGAHRLSGKGSEKGTGRGRESFLETAQPFCCGRETTPVAFVPVSLP